MKESDNIISKNKEGQRGAADGGGKQGGGGDPTTTGELSDWDSDSDEGATADAAVVQKGKAKGGFSVTQNLNIKNIRDSSASNVYHGELTSPAARPKVISSAKMRA